MSISAPSGFAVRPLIYNLDLARGSFELSEPSSGTMRITPSVDVRQMIDLRNTLPVINGIACRPSTVSEEVMDIPDGISKLRGSCRGGREVQLLDFTPLTEIIFTDCDLASSTDTTQMSFTCEYDLTGRPFLMFLFGTVLLGNFTPTDPMFADPLSVDGNNIVLDGPKAKFGNRHAAWASSVWLYPSTAITGFRNLTSQLSTLDQPGNEPFIMLFNTEDGLDCRILKSAYTLGPGSAVFRDDDWTYSTHPKFTPSLLVDDDTGAMPAYSAHVREDDLLITTKGTPVDRLSDIPRNHSMNTHVADRYPTWFPHHRPLGDRQYSMIDIYRIPRRRT